MRYTAYSATLHLKYIDFGVPLTQFWKLNISLWLGRQTHVRESGTAELGELQTIQYVTLANKRQAHQTIAEHNWISQTNYLIIDTTYNSIRLIIISSMAIYSKYIILL